MRTQSHTLTFIHLIFQDDLKDHIASHEMSSSYKNSLTSKTKKRKLNETDERSNKNPRLNSFIVFCRTFREAKKHEFPQLNMLAINAKLREDWHKLSQSEKDAYKVDRPVVLQQTANTVPEHQVCDTCNEVFMSEVELCTHKKDHHSSQLTIKKCKDCGRMFLTDTALDLHKSKEHGSSSDVSQRSGDAVIDLDDTLIGQEDAAIGQDDAVVDEDVAEDNGETNSADVSAVEKWEV